MDLQRNWKALLNLFFFFLLFSVFLVEDLLSFCFYELLYFFTYHQKNNFSLKTSRERES